MDNRSRLCAHGLNGANHPLATASGRARRYCELHLAPYRKGAHRQVALVKTMPPNIPVHRTVGQLRWPPSGDLLRYAFQIGDLACQKEN